MHEDCPVFITYTEFDIPREYSTSDFFKNWIYESGI